MTHAYDENYLFTARNNLGSFLDYAVNTLFCPAGTIWTLFIGSPLSLSYSRGDSAVVLGLSGEELAIKVITNTGWNTKGVRVKRKASISRSREYWAGWSICYYQWYTDLNYDEINEFISIEEIINMYSPYHEADISKFVDKLEELRKERVKGTKLKRMRENIGLTQRELSSLSGVPLRTIQQYEQKQKNINMAGGETLLRLARALSTTMEELLER